MVTIFRRLFFLSLLVSSFSVQSQTYIKNVNVVDVEHHKIIADQTVTIKDNRISSVQPAKSVKMTLGAVVIDGKGKFLTPGLVDAHVHFFQSGGLYTRPDAIDLRKLHPYEQEIEWTHRNFEDILRRYVREGITTVIDPGSSVSFLQQRDSFAGKSFAPTIYMAGPLVTTYEPAAFQGLKNNEPFNLVKSIEDAKAAVDAQLPYHPDFIKIWYITDIRGEHTEDSARKFLPIVKAAIDEAHKNNLRVAVHATERITAQLAVENGCDYLVHNVEDEVVSSEFIELLKKNHVVLCPTMIVKDGYMKTFLGVHKFSAYDIIRGTPDPLGSLIDFKYLPDTPLVKRYMDKGKNPRYDFTDSVRTINLKKLADGGVTIASGTDAGNIGTLHAVSYLDELNIMKKCGMSNWQILEASTINGAKAIGKEKEFGTITEGMKANLVLLDASPVIDLNNLRKIHRVINNGKILNPDSIVHETPEQIVQREVNAFNSRNMEAFLDAYDDDAEMYTSPDNRLVNKGKSAIEGRRSNLFQNRPDLHCEIKSRVVEGDTITQNEVIITSLERKPAIGKVTYVIEKGKIKKTYTDRERPREK